MVGVNTTKSARQTACRPVPRSAAAAMHAKPTRRPAIDQPIEVRQLAGTGASPRLPRARAGSTPRPSPISRSRAPASRIPGAPGGCAHNRIRISRKSRSFPLRSLLTSRLPHYAPERLPEAINFSLQIG